MDHEQGQKAALHCSSHCFSCKWPWTGKHGRTGQAAGRAAAQHGRSWLQRARVRQRQHRALHHPHACCALQRPQLRPAHICQPGHRPSLLGHWQAMQGASVARACSDACRCKSIGPHQSTCPPWPMPCAQQQLAWLRSSTAQRPCAASDAPLLARASLA